MKKIPDNAKLVFKGILHDVYQWEQEMFDGTFSVFEGIKKKYSVTIIAIVGDKIIINNEEQPGRAPFKALPGGKGEDGYTPLEDAKRELLEETGYESNDWIEWFTSDILQQGKIEWDNHFFIARNCRKMSEQNLEPGERIEVALASFDEFLEFRKNPKARNKDLFPILEKAVNNKDEKKKLKELLGIS